MATRKTPKVKPALTPAELRDAIRATVAEWFPRCADASLILIPAPGVSPVELNVTGDVLGASRLGDYWTSEERGGVWEPVEEDRP